MLSLCYAAPTQPRRKWLVFLGQDAAMWGYTVPGTTWANEMNFCMSQAPGAEFIARLVDLQSSMLPLCYDCPYTSLERQWRAYVHTGITDRAYDTSVKNSDRRNWKMYHINRSIALYYTKLRKSKILPSSTINIPTIINYRNQLHNGNYFDVQIQRIFMFEERV